MRYSSEILYRYGWLEMAWPKKNSWRHQKELYLFPFLSSLQRECAKIASTTPRQQWCLPLLLRTWILVRSVNIINFKDNKQYYILVQKLILSIMTRFHTILVYENIYLNAELAAKKSNECMACGWNIACIRRMECARVQSRHIRYWEDLGSQSSTWISSFNDSLLVIKTTLFIISIWC